MPQLVSLAAVIAIISFIGYLLIAGAIIIWPIFNILAYLKVLIFPRPIRKKYGTNLEELSKDSFQVEVAATDKNDIKSHTSSITLLKNKISNYEKEVSNITKLIKSLGNLKRNNDGSYSKRSKAGKEANILVKNRSDVKYAIAEKQYEIKLIQEKISHIKNKPWHAWNEWSSRYARYLSNQNSIIFMLVGFPVFFAILGFLNSYSFSQTFHLYVYISYIQPISDIIGIQSFQTGFSSNFISFEYATASIDMYEGVFSFWSWILYTLSMPILTLIFFLSSYKSYKNKARKVEPKTY